MRHAARLPGHSIVPQQPQIRRAPARHRTNSDDEHLTTASAEQRSARRCCWIAGRNAPAGSRDQTRPSMSLNVRILGCGTGGKEALRIRLRVLVNKSFFREAGGVHALPS
jgi:hypothetical protein